MNVRIYQINMKRDANNVAFMNYESLPKFQGSSEIDSSLYDKVFEGEVNCFTLEKLYEIFNLKHPAGYKAVSYTHLRAHETDSYLVCRLLLEKKKKKKYKLKTDNEINKSKKYDNADITKRQKNTIEP